MKKMIALSLIALAGLAGCGRSNTVYEDKKPGVTTDGLTTLPSGFYNTSVNSALADVTKYKDQSILRLKTLKGTNAGGSFNDPSFKGNFALLSLAQFDEEKLSDVANMSFESKQLSGIRPLDVYLQVDLKCDFTTPYLLHAMGSDIASTSVSGGFEKFTISSSDDVWTSHNVPVKDTTSLNTIIPETDSGNGLGNLDDLLAEYPNACVRNDQTYDPGFPNSIPTGAVQLGLGDKDETALNEIVVRKLTVGSKTFTKWSK